MILFLFILVVWFEQQPQRNYHGYTGRELAMECRAVGKEPIEYLWLKDENGKKTFIQDKPGIYVDKKSGLLMFESLVAEHWGDYNCQAQNRFHFVTSDTVKVTFEPFREKGTRKNFKSTRFLYANYSNLGLIINTGNNVVIKNHNNYLFP